jgi:hypothetical protein
MSHSGVLVALSAPVFALTSKGGHVPLPHEDQFLQP